MAEGLTTAQPSKKEEASGCGLAAFENSPSWTSASSIVVLLRRLYYILLHSSAVYRRRRRPFKAHRKQASRSSSTTTGRPAGLSDGTAAAAVTA